jgi:hypothetical protein
MFHEFFRWLQEDLGNSFDGDGNLLEPSWSQEFVGSLNLWAITEGTHVLTLMLFAGTILFVDLRMLGVAFRKLPLSTLSQKVLPLTVTGFALMIFTGALLFFAKPMDYYHSLMFRVKMIFLLIAALNIFWFYYKLQKNQAEWDVSASPPRSVKISAVISLVSWIIVTMTGRFIAFPWFDCGEPQPAFVKAFAECDALTGGDVPEEEVIVEDEPAAEDARPDDEAAPTPVLDEAAPAAPAPTEGN